MEKILVGKKEFGCLIDITDPSYDRKVWCRMNDIRIKPGVYNCFVTLANNKETEGWGTRVAFLEIIKEDNEESKFSANLGTIGVDAGMAGFFNSGHEYSAEDWEKMIYSSDSSNKYWLKPEGFYSDSGLGDGVYTVTAHETEKAGEYDALRIDFDVL